VYLEQQHLHVEDLLLRALAEVALQQARHVHEVVVGLTREKDATDAGSSREKSPMIAQRVYAYMQVM
jgi:hypothetical protein